MTLTRVRNLMLATMIAGALVMSGCSKTTEPPKPTDAAAAKKEKPLLDVPASFANEAARQEFVQKAIAEGYYQEAKTVLESALANTPDANAYVSLGTARYNLKDYAGAIEAWNKAAELDVKKAGEMLNNSGNALRDSRKPEEAKAAYEQALKLEPARWTAAVNWATLLASEGKFDQAVKVIEGAIPNNPNIQPLASLLETYKKKLG